MHKLVIAFFLSAGTAWAGELVQLNAPSTPAAIAKMQAFLSAGPRARQEQLFNELMSLKPRGLAYIDEAIKSLSLENTKALMDPTNPAGKLLASLPWALTGLQLTDDFDGSFEQAKIHENAKKLLQKLRLPSPARAVALNLFDRLNLWDKSDLGLLTTQYMINRGHAAQLIPILQTSAPIFWRDFARNVRAVNGRRELVDLLLIYKGGLNTAGETESLIRMLMENFYYTQGVAERQVYGPANKVVTDLMNDVIRSLHERLEAEDKKITKAYSKVDADPAGERLLSSDQLSKFRRFLWLLKVGDCEPALRLVTGSDDRAG